MSFARTVPREILKLVFAVSTGNTPSRGGRQRNGYAAPTLVKQAAPSGIARSHHVVTPDPSETRLQVARVLYLTSQKTAFAAEHMALALNHTGRGTVIGETTADAGNAGVPVSVGRFSVFVPFGQTFDPETGAGWEGTGVTPGIDVVAGEALRKALELAGETPESAQQLAGMVESKDLGGWQPASLRAALLVKLTAKVRGHQRSCLRLS
jgi:C-terminal processing protease CtpA/Prc